ncbi:MAG TPA: hypothetical protein DCL15_16365 [Chloroflexi bacterium]|nr:hypothetical protein [Chloroflexota bacterium]HHW89230.1 DUF4397 domain-containing protein [Chloroflexota bacterium]
MQRVMLFLVTMTLTALLFTGITISVSAQEAVAPEASANGDAIVNVAHFAPFAADQAGTSVTVAVNSTDVFTDFVFSEVITGVALPAGVYTIEVRPTGSPTVAMSGVFTLEANVEYSLLAIGDGSANMPLSLQLLVKDATPPIPGNAKVLIGHYAPFASTVPGTAVELCNDATQMVLAPVVYGQNSGYVQFPAGIYDLSIAVPGTNCAQKAFDLPPLQFNAGEFYDAFAIGKNNAAFPLDVVSLSGLDFPAMATIGHFAPFATTITNTAVDIRVNGQLAYTNVVYGQYVPDVVVPSGPLLVEILTPGGQVSAAAGDVRSAVVISGVFTLNPMSKYDLFAIGGANGWPLDFITAEISQTAPAGQALVTIGHLAPFAASGAATAVDICLESGVPLFTNVQFPTIQANVALAPNVYDLKIAVAGSNCQTVALDLPPFRLAAGDVVDAFAIGAPQEVGPAAGPDFPLEVVTTTGLRAAYESYLPTIYRSVTVAQ